MTSRKDRIEVMILDNRFIPTIGKGPINEYILITKDQYNLLTELGYTLKKRTINNPEKIDIPLNNNEISNDIIEESLEIKEKNLNEESNIIEEINESNDEISEELIDEELSLEEDMEDEEEIDVDSMTKKEIMKLLSENNIPYRKNSTLPELKHILIDNL